ncbi:MAG: VanZ family protein [Bacteroidales bacterium]|nr:VanZ family protein [Bacteroidales bacterium]
MKHLIYRIIFWLGYLAVLLTTLVPIREISLDKIFLGPEVFNIRLDHLLHFAVYFLICLYYLVGQLKRISLFSVNPFPKFVRLILILAVATELIQLWVPDRTFNMFDMLSNVIGLVAGVGVIRMVLGTKYKVLNKIDQQE